jgi:ATP-binding cassette subfamily B protein
LPARERIEEALTAAALDSFIAGLPEGLETQIGTKGVKLSGGEKQRLSLARAILRDPEILILDEATSALDSATELRIQAALESLFRGRTVLIIAHRLSTVTKADQVLVLEEGQIVESGTPGELIESGGKFARYWQLQSPLSKDTSWPANS